MEFRSLSSERHVITTMADGQQVLDSHNRLCLAVSSALGSIRDPSQLLALKSEVEGMLQLLDEVCCCVFIVCIGGINYSWN